MNKWQPIETAPRDGSYVLLALVESEGEDYFSLVTLGSWFEGQGDTPDQMGQDDGWRDHTFEEFCPGRSFGNPKYQSEGCQPTHWMPLPKPPMIDNINEIK